MTLIPVEDDCARTVALYARRQKRAQSIVNRLCVAFGVPQVTVDMSLRRRGWLGAYHRVNGVARIELRPFADLETLAHEFAHHLDHSISGTSDEPPVTLPDVRAHIRGTEEFRDDELSFLELELVPEEWRLDQ